MKIMVSIFTLLFAVGANAALEMSNTRYPLVKCASNAVIANVYNLPDEKRAQMVVQMITRTGPVTVYNEIVQPMSSDESQVFVAEKASLRVIPNGRVLKGFLNLRLDQPGVGQVLNCTTYAHILSAAEVM